MEVVRNDPLIVSKIQELESLVTLLDICNNKTAAQQQTEEQTTQKEQTEQAQQTAEQGAEQHEQQLQQRQQDKPEQAQQGQQNQQEDGHHFEAFRDAAAEQEDQQDQALQQDGEHLFEALRDAAAEHDTRRYVLHNYKHISTYTHILIRTQHMHDYALIYVRIHTQITHTSTTDY